MKTIPVRTRQDDVSDAVRSIDEAIRELERMRGHLQNFPADSEPEDQLGTLRGANRCGKIASAMTEQALTHVRGAQCSAQLETSVS